MALTQLQSSSTGVSLGPLRVLNNGSYSLSRELISSKLSNQHWRAWRALKECRLHSDWRLFKKKYLIITWKLVLICKLGHSNKGDKTRELKTYVCNPTHTHLQSLGCRYLYLNCSLPFMVYYILYPIFWGKPLQQNQCLTSQCLLAHKLR